MDRKNDTRRMVTLALFTALVAVLQLVATLLTRFTPLPVSITLSLVPIVVGAALYGAGAGAYLGSVLGVVVLLTCVGNLDLGGAMLWNASPLWCAVVCVAKSAAAGAVAAVVYRALAGKNQTGAAVCAGIAAPVVNTGIFILAVVFLFRETLEAWAGGEDLAVYIITGLAGINFLLELAVNLVLAPVIVRIVNARQK